VRTKTQQIGAVPVRVLDGTILYRHGRSWTVGQVLAVEPHDAKRLVDKGLVERARV
jgi:hypothetical protein